MKKRWKYQEKKGRRREYEKLIHGGDVYRNPDCIDFSANINPLGPPDSVKKAVAACVNDIAHYPDVQCKELKKGLDGQSRWKKRR